MKNNFFYLLVIILFCNFLSTKTLGEVQFNFNVSEIEILENGNLIKGLKKGVVNTNEGLSITADEFEYDKSKNILNATGNVKIENEQKNYLIYSDGITYFKNDEKIKTTKNSKAIFENNKIIEANRFLFDNSKNILNAVGNVKIENKLENYFIYSDEVNYFKNEGNISTSGKTRFLLRSKFEIITKDILFIEKIRTVTSDKETKILDNNSNAYILNKFSYQIDKQILKGEEIIITSNYKLPKSDTLFLSSAIIDLKNNKFVAKDTKFEIHEDVFGDKNNNPRLIGLSSKGDDIIKVINKGIFTSCKKTDKCPPWSLQAEKITHNKNKKQLKYKNAILKIYDFPVMYFPSFFHPDPTVKRQSGLLMPRLNNSNNLGNSASVPYYKVISDNQDYTLTTHLFENNLKMFENEYRQVNKNSNFDINFGYINGYKPSLETKKKNIFNIFLQYKKDLNLSNFTSSDLVISAEKVNNDTFLKVFDQNIQDTKLKPNNSDILVNTSKLLLNHESYNFETGIIVYENLQKRNNDRYQFILPYYNYDKIFTQNFLNGELYFASTGNNNLSDTNVLETKAINDLNYTSDELVSNLGFSSNFEIDVKNLTSIGKKSSNYKSSPQIELMSMYSLNTSIPLSKKVKNYNNFLNPKLSLKFNPHDMKNYTDKVKNINMTNIFLNNRLEISDTLEAGRSLTLGLDYKKEQIDNPNKFLEISLAKVLRDQEEKFIPKNTTLNKKNSNLFGSIKTNFSDLIDFKYNFALDNSYKNMEYNELNTTINFKNLSANFNFIKESGDMGDDSIFDYKTTYKINEDNFINFNTRRNRKLSLTEYYNLVYEYKNDCLTAGIKYNKTFYEDRELKPSENLFFTITLIPLADYEQKISN